MAEDFEAGVRELFDRFALFTSYDDTESSGKILLSTYHGAKGLEFENVFLVGFNDEIIPSSRSSEKGDIEEERRVAYVGITRAKKRLYVSWLTAYRLVTGKEIGYRSLFLEELKNGK